MKPYKEQTYYELLEIDPTVSMDEIRAAYQRSIRLYDSENVALYPLGDPSQVEELKKLLLEAMEILTDEDLRVEYDKSLGIETNYRPNAPAPLGLEVAQAALEEPPGPAQTDIRAAEARKEADAHAEQQAHSGKPHPEPHPHQPPAQSVVHQEPGVVDGAVPTATEVDDRAEDSRAEADDAAQHPDPGPDAEPAQLVMSEVVSKAETVHSTAPRFSISYIPHVPAPIRELSAQSTTGAPSAAPSSRATPAPSTGESSGHGFQPEPGAPTSSAAVAEASPPPALSEAVTTAAPISPTAPSAPAPAAPAAGSASETPVASPESPPEPSKPRALEQAPVIAQESAIAAAESALAQVSAHVAQRDRVRESPRPRALEVPEDAVYSGELFRQVRQNRGVTLHQLADRTRISSRHLENLEADRYDALPATVYLRGMLMSVARELGLDALRACRSYLALVEKERARK